MVFVIHVFTVAYFYCCYSPGVEPWLPNCEGFDINGTCLLLVPLSICYFFSFKSFTLKIDSGVYSRQPGNHYKKGFGNSRLEDFNSGKIMLTRYYIDWQIHLVWMIIERMTNLVYCIYKEDITCILEVFFLVYWKRRCDIDPDLFYFFFSPLLWYIVRISSTLYSHCRGSDVHQHMFSPTSAPGLQHLKFPFSADCALVTSPLVFYLNSQPQSNPSSPCYSHPFQWR